MGYVLARGEAKSIALHDCDITTYNQELLARLFIQLQIQILIMSFVRGTIHESPMGHLEEE